MMINDGRFLIWWARVVDCTNELGWNFLEFFCGLLGIDEFNLELMDMHE